MSIFPKIDPSEHYGDFRDDLARDGYVVIKGAIPRERALGYRDDFYTFMENFTELGFRRDDPTTWTQDHLPILHKGGLINHSVGHERFMWQIRCEPGVIEPFAKIWQDDCLLVSFDGGNLALPGKMQDFKAEKWAHVDQSVSKLGIRNIQGIVNLAPNGPEDGGLLVLPGSHQLYDGFFSDDWYKTADEAYRPGGARHKEDSYHFKPHEYAWFEGKCPDWVKVCAEPGDLILWESRTMHYNCPPSSASDRCAVYVSYEPAAMADEHNKQLKRKGFDERFTSTHWAISQVKLKDQVEMRNGQPCPHMRRKPFTEPIVTPRLLKLAGVEAY